MTDTVRYNDPEITRMITIEFEDDEEGIKLGAEFLRRISPSFARIINEDMRIHGGTIYLLKVRRGEFEDYIVPWLKGETVFLPGERYSKKSLSKLRRLAELGAAAQVDGFRETFENDIDRRRRGLV